MSYQGLFVGLTTLDFIYLSDRHIQPNEKIVAQDYLTAAGGPATNAAVAFSYFGNKGKLLTVLGEHPLNQLIKSDLANYAIEIIDLIPHKSATPPVSSIIVTANTGERSVISLNALQTPPKRSRSYGEGYHSILKDTPADRENTRQTVTPLSPFTPPSEQQSLDVDKTPSLGEVSTHRAVSLIPQDILEGINIILIDGHQIDISLAIIEIAKDNQIPVVLDGGSWKPGLETVLPYVDYAICSANFYPPECTSPKEVFDFLKTQGIDRIAITQGKQPILYLEDGQIESLAVPIIKAVDTLGAGDIFHGAFCHYILQKDFPAALNHAAHIASQSCQYFGTREWLIAK